MSRSKATLSITRRMLLDFIKYKTNNNHTFFMSNEKIADALGLTVSSAKVMINELIRNGYLIKETDPKGRRILALSGKEYLPITCENLSSVDKRVLLQELANTLEELNYTKQELKLANIRIQKLENEMAQNFRI